MKAREILIASCLAVAVTLFVGAFDTQLWAQAEKPAPVVITEDTTWSGSVTVDRPVHVQKGTLSITPGTRVTFKADGLISVSKSGALVAQGSEKKPVLLAGEASGGINVELGRIVLEHCHVTGLSKKVGKHLQWLTGKAGKEGVILRRCTLTDCGGISLSLSGPFEMSGCELRNCRGNIRLGGKGKAVVSDNTMQGGGLSVGSGADVLIAGNVVIGGTVSAFRADKAVIEDNYVHQPLGKGTYGLLRVEAITRNNVVRGGTWVSARMGGQITDNVFLSIDPEEILKAKKSFDKNCTHEHICGLLADSRVIRNIFVGASYAGIMGIGHGTGSDSVIRNNTFDMHGRGCPVTLNHFPENNPKNIRIRNNIFMRCGPVWNEWGRPGSISSIDYNLWADAGKKERFRNFKGATVVGKKPGETGFGGNDVPSSAERKKVLPPESIVANPDVKFPFTDEDMLARKHTVAEILKVYRDAYTLKAGSPAINAGDPTDKDDPAVKDGRPDIGALERTGR